VLSKEKIIELKKVLPVAGVPAKISG
jgi:hypothetical protein